MGKANNKASISKTRVKPTKAGSKRDGKTPKSQSVLAICINLINSNFFKLARTMCGFQILTCHESVKQECIINRFKRSESNRLVALSNSFLYALVYLIWCSYHSEDHYFQFWDSLVLFLIF